MGAQRSSASKRQRDIDKRSRAAEKRDRRQRRSALGDDDTVAAGDDALPVGAGDSSAILEEVEQLHRDFEANVIDFETYETRKVELLSRLQV